MNLTEMIESLDNRFDFNEFRTKYGEIEGMTIDTFACIAGGIAVRENTKDIWTTKDKSRGLGDTVAKITHLTGLDKLATAYTAVTGQDCGCGARQEALNGILPYK